MLGLTGGVLTYVDAVMHTTKITTKRAISVRNAFD